MLPISEITNTNGNPGTNGHLNVDGTAPDTGNYWNGVDNTTAVLEVLMTDLSATAPTSGTCTVTVYESACDTNNAPDTLAGAAVTYDIEVYELTTSKGSSTGNTPTDSTFTANSAVTFDASTISDWTDVRVRLTTVGNGGSPSGRRQTAFSHIAIATPDAPVGGTKSYTKSFGRHALHGGARTVYNLSLLANKVPAVSSFVPHLVNIDGGMNKIQGGMQ